MATTEYQRLPPSPPPSPPHRRHPHQRKKRPDPFFDLDLPTDRHSSSPPSSPRHVPQEPEDPLITRIIFTPLYFVSFLVSLFLINRAERARRTTSHPPTPSLLSYFTPSVWLDPEPYQDPRDSTWGRDVPSHAQPPNPGRGHKKRKSWFLRKKIRKIAQLEIGDALEMRGRVAVVIAAIVLVLCAGVVMGCKWVVGRLL